MKTKSGIKKMRNLLIFLTASLISISCTYSVYSTSDEIVVYEDQEGEHTYTFYLLPDNLFLFRKEIGDSWEYMLMEARGGSASHFIGPFYNVSADNSLFGWRVYPDALEVWNMEFYVLANKSSFKSRTLPEQGTTFRDILLLEDKKIKLGSSRYFQRDLTDYDRVLIQLSLPDTN